MSWQLLQGSEIFVVDDDPLVRETLTTLLTREGCQVACFADGDSFLAAARERTPACVLLDVNMPGRSGLDILRQLNAAQYPAPVLIVSGRSDIPTAVSAIKCGAIDYIEKPFERTVLVERLTSAIGSAVRPNANGGTTDIASLPQFAGWETLTPREHEVLLQITRGASNKEVGRQLGISPRTIEVHRARIMDKLGARNAADLVRMVLAGRGS
jgi:two-component system response regulator FixJ